MSTTTYTGLPRVRPHPLTAAALLVSVVIFLVFGALVERIPTISDPLGYLYAGQRLAEGRGPTYEDANDAIAGPYFVMYAFQVSRAEESTHYLGFPPGFPLLLAGGALVGAADFVVPLLAGLTVLATYGLGTALTGRRGAGLAAAVMLALTPAFWEFGTAAFSEIPATLTVTGGLYFFLKSRTGPKRVLVFSLAAAMLLSYGHFIRYTNVTFLAAPALYDLVSAGRRLPAERWRWPFWLAVGVGLLAIPLFNHFYYGGAAVTSYSPTHGWYPHPPFALAYALGPSFVNGYSLRESAATLWRNFSVTLLLVAFGWWKMPAAARALVGAAVFFGLLPYLFYAFAPAGINSRFLLPIFPFLCTAAGHGTALLVDRIDSKVVQVMAGATVMLAALVISRGHTATLTERNQNNRATAALAVSLVADTEPESVVLSYVYNDMIAVYGGRSVLNYRRIPASDPVEGRFHREMLEPCLVGAVDRLLDQGIPVYYIEDQQPSYWGTLEIMRRYYALSEPAHTPSVYRIGDKTGPRELDESACRFPAGQTGEAP